MLQSKWYGVRGVDYFVEMGDREEGKVPALFLHGFTNNHTSWQPILAHLPHLQPILPDLLGHGQTSSPTDPHRYQMAQASTDLAFLLSQLISQPAHLIGYSMGGRIALHLALNYPHLFRSLTLESASPGLKTESERAVRRQNDEQLAQKLEQNGLESFITFWENLPLFANQQTLPPETRLCLQQQRLQNNPLGLANSLRGMGTGSQPSLWERLPELHLPTLLLVGELDPKFTTLNQQMVDLIPHVRLVVLPSAGHTPHLEQPLLFTQQLSLWTS